MEISGRATLVTGGCNNAGGYSTPTHPANSDWRSALELNLLSVMEAIEHAVPWIVRLPGGVVNIASSSTSRRPPATGRMRIAVL